MKHPYFISRTVLVKNNKVEEAVSVLNKILGREGVLSDARRIMFYEKPWQTCMQDMQERHGLYIQSTEFGKIGLLIVKKSRVEYELFFVCSHSHGTRITTRRRICFIRAKAICNEEMDRKVNFLMRKNRIEPYPGCY